MDFSAYRRLWAIPTVRRTVLGGFFGRTPWFGAGVILTLHIVNKLGMSYSAAGLVTAVFSVAAGAASPWRGKMLDTKGLRRTLIPSLVALPIIFTVAPLVSYWWLTAGMVLAGGLAVPWFSLVRSVILNAAPPEEERAVMSLDSLFVEFSFMLGPAAGIVACVYWDTGLALTTFTLISIVATGWLYWLNPPLSELPPQPRLKNKRVRWFGFAAAIAMAGTLSANFALAGTDLALIAVMRDSGHEPLIGPAMVLWALGSLVGGLTYGAMRRKIPLWLFIAALSVTTVMVGMAPNLHLTFAALFLAGLFCAPTLTASVEVLNQVVPPSHRGESMGWYGTAATIGSSLGPPVIGWWIDHVGAAPGFVLSGLGGALLFVAGAALLQVIRRVRRHRRFA